MLILNSYTTELEILIASSSRVIFLYFDSFISKYSYILRKDEPIPSILLSAFSDISLLEIGTAEGVAAPEAAAAAAHYANECYVPNPRTGNEEIMPIFVASDNAGVLTTSSSMGLLVSLHGVSQTTQSAGMKATLGDKAELRYNATLEIVRDIYLLSRCSHLVGIAASQVFRMAVGISNATSTLVMATAVDQKEIPRVTHLSAVHGLPFVEAFAVPMDHK